MDEPSASPQRPRLEIAAFTLRSALSARSGAQRIELCSGARSEGGLTPTVSDLRTLRNASQLQIHVMIRPVAGTFNYSDDNFQQMKDAVSSIQKETRGGGSGRCIADGFVFGILTADGEVDVARCSELAIMAKAGGQRCTFHRAFDEIMDRKKGLEDVIRCGFDAVLTAGGPGSVAEHAESLAETIDLAAGRIEIIAGGGVRSKNIRELAERVGRQPAWWHSAAIVDGEEECSAEEVKQLRRVVDPENVEAAKAKV